MASREVKKVRLIVARVKSEADTLRHQHEGLRTELKFSRIVMRQIHGENRTIMERLVGKADNTDKKFISYKWKSQILYNPIKRDK